MNYVYTPLDPVIWSIFVIFLIAAYLIIKVYHRIYPNYPKGTEKDED
jgi:hypothetical protein